MIYRLRKARHLSTITPNTDVENQGDAFQPRAEAGAPRRQLGEGTKEPEMEHEEQWKQDKRVFGEIQETVKRYDKDIQERERARQEAFDKMKLRWKNIG